jgi:hypothetical protein
MSLSHKSNLAGGLTSYDLLYLFRNMGFLAKVYYLSDFRNSILLSIYILGLPDTVSYIFSKDLI